MSSDPPPTPNPDDPLYHSMIYDPTDYYGYDLPEWQGEAAVGDTHADLPRGEEINESTPLGEAELQYLPFERRPLDLDVPDYALDEDGDSDSIQPDIEDMYFWVAGMSDELTATHALVWRRISSLLEQASGTLRSRADALRSTWEGDAASNFLAWVGSTLFSIDEWKGVAANNAYVLEVIGPAIRDAQEQLRPVYSHYLGMAQMWERWKEAGPGSTLDLHAQAYRAAGLQLAWTGGTGGIATMPVVLPDSEGWDPAHSPVLPAIGHDEYDLPTVDVDNDDNVPYVMNERKVVELYQHRAADIVRPLAQTYVNQHYWLTQGRQFAGPLELGMPSPVFDPGALAMPAPAVPPMPAMPGMPGMPMPDVPIPAPVANLPMNLAPLPVMSPGGMPLPPELQQLLDGGQLAGGPMRFGLPVLQPGQLPALPGAPPPVPGMFPPVPSIPPGFAPPGSAPVAPSARPVPGVGFRPGTMPAGMAGTTGAGTQPTSLSGALPGAFAATAATPGQVPVQGSPTLPGATANQLPAGAMMPPPPPPIVPPMQATQRRDAANQPPAGAQSRGLAAGAVPPVPPPAFIPPGRATQQGRTPTVPQRVQSTLPGTAARPPARGGRLAGMRGAPGHPGPVAPMTPVAPAVAGRPAAASQRSGQRPEQAVERVSVPGEHDGELWTVKRPKGLIQSASPHRPADHGKPIGSPG